MISVKYSVKDDDLLTMYRGGANVNPFILQTVQFEDVKTAIAFALMKATATRVDGFKKQATVTEVDGDIMIEVVDVASKKRD